MRVLLEPINACQNDHGDNSCNQQSSHAERNNSSNDHSSKL